MYVSQKLIGLTHQISGTGVESGRGVAASLSRRAIRALGIGRGPSEGRRSRPPPIATGIRADPPSRLIGRRPHYTPAYAFESLQRRTVDGHVGHCMRRSIRPRALPRCPSVAQSGAGVGILLHTKPQAERLQDDEGRHGADPKFHEAKPAAAVVIVGGRVSRPILSSTKPNLRVA
jgi:hypothetical protein